MQVMLVNSPIYRNSVADDEDYLPPLGLGYIATSLNRIGVSACIVDAVRERLGVEEVIQKIGHVRPDYVGINVFSPNYHLVKEIVERSRPMKGFLVGGQVVKHIYEHILGWEVASDLIAIIGEGELIIPAVVNGECEERPIKHGGNRRVYRVDKESRYYPRDISTLELDRRLFGDSSVVNHYGQREEAIVTSRGCPFDCAFCGGARSLNKDVHIRCRDEESIVSEIEGITQASPEVRSIRVLDDLFLRNAKSVELANGVFRRFPTLSWRGMAHVHMMSRDAGYAESLLEGRCRELFVGVESGSESMRKRINKVGSVDHVLAASRHILRCGIDLKAYFIYGFPGETKRDFEDTYRLACEIAEYAAALPGSYRTSAFQFRPYHGTRLYHELFDDSAAAPAFFLNDELAQSAGRAQFSFSAGNYSQEPIGVVNSYVQKTLELATR